MVQKPPMGAGMAPPPASPANPTALNFQSDPSMRQQFKGFMSGLSNRPMPQPMSAPMPMYTPAANVDIFEPIQGFANGGGVTFSSGSDYSPGEGISISSGTVQGDDTFGGRSDRRDSIGLNDPYEAEMIQTGKSFLDDFGFSTSDDSGPVAFGIGARPSVNLSARTMPASGGDALSQQIGKRSSYDDAPMTSRGLLTNQGQANAAMGRGSGFGATGATQSVTGSPTASGYDDFGLDVLNLLGNVDLLDSDAVMRQALDSSARLTQDAYGQVFVNEDMTDLPGGAARVSGRPIQTPDEIAYNDTMMRTDMSPADMQRIQREREAQDITRRGGTVDVNPDTGQIIANYPQTPSMLDTVPQSIPTPIGMPDEIRSMRDTFNDLDVFGPNIGGAPVTIGTPKPRPDTPFEQGAAAGERVAQGEPSGTSSNYYSEAQGGFGRERTEAGRTNRVADSGFGTGEVTLAAGSRQPADRQGFFTTLLDTMTGRQFPTDEEIVQNIADASARRTTITGDKRRQDMSALDQLANRAGREGSGIFGAITNFGASNAAKMYEDIVNKGYEPIYDNRGQIVATRVPGTNILGSGSVESRISGRNQSTGGESQPQPSVADLVAAEIKRLGVGQEGDVAAPVTPPPSATPTTPSVPSAPTPQAPAPLARPLRFGYGQIQGINPNLDDAANKFLGLLGGFAEGGEVKNFRGGGGVGRQDYEGASISGVTGDVAGSSTSDVGSMGSRGQQASGRSFSGADLYGGGDDNGSVQSVMATPLQMQSVMATPLEGSAPQADKLVSVEGSQSQPQIQQQQMAPRNMIQTQVGAIDPASMSMGEKASLIGEGLGNLLDFDLFSAPGVDEEMAARFEAAGFSPSAAASIATPTGGLFDIPKPVPIGAAQTSYKQFATTPETKIDIGKVDMGDRGFGFSGFGDLVARAYDATKQKLSTALDPVDYSNLDQLGQNLRNQ